jgi:hypothetical protein
VRWCIDISINNPELVGTDRKSICGDPSVPSVNVTVYAKDNGHAVINFTLVNGGDNRYDTMNAGLCNYSFKATCVCSLFRYSVNISGTVVRCN